jgi:hypothetical protein
LEISVLLDRLVRLEVPGRAPQSQDPKIVDAIARTRRQTIGGV